MRTNSPPSTVSTVRAKPLIVHRWTAADANIPSSSEPDDNEVPGWQVRGHWRSQFPQAYGVETQEEMDAAEEEAAREYWDGLYPQLIAYVRGEPNRIEPDTGGERYAQIACELVSEDASLLWPENRDAFIHAVQEAFLDKHAVRVELPDEQMEEALRIGTLRSQLMLGEVEDITTDSTQRH
jgi:hypothetical protein